MEAIYSHAPASVGVIRGCFSFASLEDTRAARGVGTPAMVKLITATRQTHNHGQYFDRRTLRPADPPHSKNTQLYSPS